MTRPRKTSIMITALFFLSLVWVPRAFSSLAQNGPVNVVWIEVRGLRADALGAYDKTIADTPVMDGLALRGALFKNFFHSTPHGLPNAASLFTGLYPPRHGLRDDVHFKLTDEIMTLPEILKKNGYHNYGFTSSGGFSDRSGFDQGFDIFDNTNLEKGLVQKSFFRDLLPAAKLNEKIFDSLESGAAFRENKPFFLWVEYSDVRFFSSPQSDRSLEHLTYESAVTEVDRQIGELIEFLRKKKKYQNTIFILTSSAPDRFRGPADDPLEADLKDRDLAAPLIISGDKFFKRPVVVDSLAGSVDLLPTLIDLLSFERAPDLDGLSFASAFREHGQGSRETLYLESLGPFNRAGLPISRGIRGAEQKLVLLGDREEFYDLRSDPLELAPAAAGTATETSALRKALSSIEKNFSVEPTRMACFVCQVPTEKASGSFAAAGGGIFESKFLGGLYFEPSSLSQGVGGLLTGRLPKVKKQKYFDVIADLEKELELAPNLRLTRLLLAKLYLLNPEYRQKALTQFYTLLSWDPSFAPAYQALSQIYYSQKEVERFEGLWLFGKETNLNNDPFYRGLAYYYWNSDQMPKLSALLAEYEVGSPEKASELWAFLSARAFFNNKWDQSFEYSGQALKLNSLNLPARMLRADILLRRGELDAAMEEIKPLKQFYPEAWERVLKQGVLYHSYSKKDFIAAERILLRFQAEHRDSEQADFSQAAFFKARGNTEEALKILKRVLRGSKSDQVKLEAARAIAEIHTEREEWGEAKKYYSQALLLDPYQAPMANNMAWIRGVKDNELDEAFKWMQCVFSTQSYLPSYLDTLAELYYLAGKPLYALRVQREAFLKTPANPVVREHFLKYRDDIRMLHKLSKTKKIYRSRVVEAAAPSASDPEGNGDAE